jgi:hypothetical protein
VRPAEDGLFADALAETVLLPEAVLFAELFVCADVFPAAEEEVPLVAAGLFAEPLTEPAAFLPEELFAELFAEPLTEPLG